MIFFLYKIKAIVVVKYALLLYKRSSLLRHTACLGQQVTEVSQAMPMPMSIPLCVPGTAWWPCLSRGLPGSSRAGLGSCPMDLLLISLQKVRDWFCSLVWGLLCLGFLAGCLCSWQSAAKVLLGAGGWADFGLLTMVNIPMPFVVVPLWSVETHGKSCQLQESQIAGVQICFPVF